MKTAVLSALFLFTILTCSFSQQIITLEITKPIEEYYSPKTRIVMYLPQDLTGFDLDNPIDPVLSTVEIFRDDTGRDLLEDHNKAMENQEQEIFSFYGIGDYDQNKDIQVALELAAIPVKGATKLHIEGKVYLNYMKEGEEKTAQLKKLSMMQPDGIETSIGELMIQEYGSVSTDDEEFFIYKISSPNVMITKISAIDGAAAEAYKGVQALGVGIESNEFVLKSRAEKSVNLEVTYSSMDKVEVPIELDFSIGF
ncbi:MAG: hypothetical protein ACFHWX_13745 [Bacteroidota bacterium]